MATKAGKRQRVRREKHRFVILSVRFLRQAGTLVVFRCMTTEKVLTVVELANF
jgi:hypothetical protein